MWKGCLVCDIFQAARDTPKPWLVVLYSGYIYIYIDYPVFMVDSFIIQLYESLLVNSHFSIATEMCHLEKITLKGPPNNSNSQLFLWCFYMGHVFSQPFTNQHVSLVVSHKYVWNLQPEPWGGLHDPTLTSAHICQVGWGTNHQLEYDMWTLPIFWSSFWPSSGGVLGWFLWVYVTAEKSHRNFNYIVYSFNKP